MQNKIPTQFDTKQLIALYMVQAKTNVVSSTNLYKFNEYISEKLCARDSKISQDKKFNSMFLLSGFHLNRLGLDSTDFKISNKDENGVQQITYTPKAALEKSLKALKEQVLSIGEQNPEFLKAVWDISKQYMKENNIAQPKLKQKSLTQEEEDERWWRYFGPDK